MSWEIRGEFWELEGNLEGMSKMWSKIESKSLGSEWEITGNDGR